MSFFNDPLSFLPLFNETLERIRTRMDADVNNGVDPTDPSWQDTREGGFYWDLSQVGGLEIGRLWDAIGSETVAAAFPSLAWGPYLDEHGLTFNLVRNPSTPASGDVLFTSAGKGGIQVASGTQVGSEPSDPSLDTVSFITTDTGATAAPLNVPTGTTVVAATGTLPIGTYYYHVTAWVRFTDAAFIGANYNSADFSPTPPVYPTLGPGVAYGETTGSPDVPLVVASGVSGATISWTAVSGATGYNIYRSQVANSLGNLVGTTTTAVTFTDNGSVTPTQQEPSYDTTPSVLLPVTGVITSTTGSDGNLSAQAITTLESISASITGVTNPYQTTGGTDVESDEAFRSRILGQYQSHGAGNIADYVSWALAYPGVERAICIPTPSGPGTVLVIAMLADGTAVSAATVTGLQEQLDPTPGQGDGLAPIGAQVNVVTTVNLSVPIVATVTTVTGYTLDGTGGTIAIRQAIVNSLAAYIATLNPGDVVSYQKVLSSFFVDGVKGVTGLTVGGGSVDITLTTTPAQNPVLPTPTLTQG
jgi:uncharacterized phage protein gp47/JayE